MILHIVRTSRYVIVQQEIRRTNGVQQFKFTFTAERISARFQFDVVRLLTGQFLRPANRPNVEGRAATIKKCALTIERELLTRIA